MNTAFFDSLIDDFGIWEHSDGNQPLRGEGYALDDAARGLIFCLLTKHPKTDVLFDYVAKSFDGERLFGFAYTTRRFWGVPASEDATGQVVWAMGLAVHLKYRTEEARELVERARRILGKPEYIRGSAYALLGAIYVDQSWARELAMDITARFEETKKVWPWPEAYLTYANGIIPYALLRYAKHAGDAETAKLGLGVLEFLHRICRLHGHLGPIGNAGWYSRATEEPPVYSQQPIDAAYMLWSMLVAHEVTHHEEWLKGAQEWLEWFEGNNIAGERLYDPETNKCHDGIDDPARLSTHSGAESNICWLLTLWAWKHKRTF